AGRLTGEVLEEDVGGLARVPGVAVRDVADARAVRGVQGQRTLVRWLRRWRADRPLELGIAEEPCLAQEIARTLEATWVEVEDAELVGHVQETPERILSDDATRRPRRARSFIAVLPPGLRHGPQPLRLMVADEDLVRPVRDRVVERPQMRSH